MRGRGSSVGSLVCYLLGLSGIDPIKYNLAVERFLSEDRPDEDVPDIDLDFGREARAEMFRHVFEEYTTEHAAMVCNFIEYRYPAPSATSARRWACRRARSTSIAKRMHSRFAGGLRGELAGDAGVREPARSSRSGATSSSWSSELRGLPRHLSQHSGGIIISTNRIDEQVPVEATAMDGRFICQWDKDSVADAGFIKLDFLGYPSLDQLEPRPALRRASATAASSTRNDIDLDGPSGLRDDPAAATSWASSRSRAGPRSRCCCASRSRSIEDLIIQVALIRPGPIQGGAVHPYIARCLGQEEVTYDHPSLEPVAEGDQGRLRLPGAGDPGRDGGRRLHAASRRTSCAAP